MARLSLQNYIPFLKHKDVSEQSWTTAGNTHTVTDKDVKENSLIEIMHTSAYAGRWRVTVANGSFLITSSDSEATSVRFRYIIL